MLPLEDALAQMLNQLPFPTKTETLALTEAADRVCAEDVISPHRHDQLLQLKQVIVSVRKM